MEKRLLNGIVELMKAMCQAGCPDYLVSLARLRAGWIVSHITQNPGEGWVNNYVHECYDKSARYDPLRGRNVIGAGCSRHGTCRVNKIKTLRAFFNL